MMSNATPKCLSTSILLSGFLVVLLISTFTADCSAMEYRVHDLGVLGSKYCGAIDINNSGQIVGAFLPPYAVNSRACLWQLGKPVQDLAPTAYYAEALGINDAGDIVGTIVDDSGLHAFLYHNNSLQSLDGYWGTAYDINNNEQVIGSVVADGRKPVLWQNGTVFDLDIPNAKYINAYSINDVGQVVGYYYASDGSNNAFIWQNNTAQYLGSLGSGITSAHDINNNGQVVGMSSKTAYIWQDNNMQSLGVTEGYGSCAWGINNNGTVVGYTFYDELDTEDMRRAFVWQDGNLQYLNTLGGNYSRAFAINDHGQIVGIASDADGVWHAVTWEPVPESSSIIALLCGLGGMVGCAFHRKM